MRNLIREGLAIFVVLTWPLLADAQESKGFMNGNQLYPRCKSPDSDRLICLGYVLGIADLMAAGAEVFGSRACFPPHVSSAQLTDVVEKALIEHPEMRHYLAAGLVSQALAEAFPCSS